MKLIREHINEKFEEDSDPINDMNIGKIYFIKKWLSNTNPFNNPYLENKIIINNDLTIDINHDLDISYDYLTIIPEYIKFNKIDGNFACNFSKNTIIKSGPKIVNGYYHLHCNYQDVPTIKFLETRCKIKDEITVWKNGLLMYRKYKDFSHNIYEKFTEDGDPIKDMNIGMIREIKDFFDKHNYGNHFPYSDWMALNMSIDNKKYDFIKYFIDSPGLDVKDKISGLRYSIFTNNHKAVRLFLNAGFKVKDALDKKDVIDLRRFYNINKSIHNIIDKEFAGESLIENVNEKFEEDSDPIKDLNIGYGKWLNLSLGDIIYSEYDDQMTIIKSTKFNEDTHKIDILGVIFWYPREQAVFEKRIKYPLKYLSTGGFSTYVSSYTIDYLHKYYQLIKYKEK